MSAATIGSALVEKRLELGLEKGQAADKIGMSRTTYSSYEQDAQRPSVDVFPALAGFLGISIEELLSLYGATCVAAVRPSLDRVLSEQQNGSVRSESFEESELLIEASIPAQSDTSYESPVTPPEVFESTPTEPSLETLEVIAPEDSPESEDVVEAIEVEEVRMAVEEEAPVAEPVFDRSPAFEPTPFIVKAPKSEDREKNTGEKKKKKKKKKKN
jgi:transcriptional regulator with XRE-family HTH domain